MSGLSCKAPSACLRPTVKQSVRSAIANCSLGWNDHERVWAMSRVRFVVASPSKVCDQFNAPKVSKELQSKRIDAASSLGVLDGLRRVEKVWDVPVRLSSSDASRAVEGCVASCCSKLGCVSRMLLRLLHVASVCSIPAPCTFRKVVASLLRWWSTSLTLRTCIRAQTRLLSQMTKPRRICGYFLCGCINTCSGILLWWLKHGMCLALACRLRTNGA